LTARSIEFEAIPFRAQKLAMGLVKAMGLQKLSVSGMEMLKEIVMHSESEMEWVLPLVKGLELLSQLE
jgi:hypothetical protein